MGDLGTTFLRRPPLCTKRPLIFLNYHMKAQNAHPETKHPGGRYRDMGERFVIFRLKIRKKDAFVRPFKVIYAIYDSLGIITVQNCAKKH